MKYSILMGLFLVIMAQITFRYANAKIPQKQSDIIFSFAPLVKKTVPSVVNIYAARKVRVRSPFEGDPFFEQFF
ncbi:MAG: serine protease, partial [Bartonella sp.]|nr:serine protease [Bartonella sp.]